MIVRPLNKLLGPVLDALVARAQQYPWSRQWAQANDWAPSENWADAGPIIEREKIELRYYDYDMNPYWGAMILRRDGCPASGAIGATPLIAAMRCYVSSRYGELVPVPEDVLEVESDE